MKWYYSVCAMREQEISQCLTTPGLSFTLMSLPLSSTAFICFFIVIFVGASMICLSLLHSWQTHNNQPCWVFTCIHFFSDIDLTIQWEYHSCIFLQYQNILKFYDCVMFMFVLFILLNYLTKWLFKLIPSFEIHQSVYVWYWELPLKLA